MGQRDEKLQGVNLATGTKVGKALYHAHHSAMVPVVGTDTSRVPKPEQLPGLDLSRVQNGFSHSFPMGCDFCPCPGTATVPGCGSMDC